MQSEKARIAQRKPSLYHAYSSSRKYTQLSKLATKLLHRKAFNEMQPIVDRQAAKGLIHKNKAARRKG
ncbi:30S ribosomal protein S20 [Shigella flexneri]